MKKEPAPDAADEFINASPEERERIRQRYEQERRERLKKTRGE